MPGSSTSHRNQLPDVQGGLIGFNKDFVRLLFFDFVDGPNAQACVTELLPQLATAEEVLDFNAQFKKITKRGGDALHEISATWVNLWLTVEGLTKLGASGVTDLPTEFQEGLGTRSVALGDQGSSANDNWGPPFTGGQAPDAALYIASDEADNLERRVADMVALLAKYGTTVVTPQDGCTRPGDMRGREHFGFKDGISQPGVAGFTKASKSETIPAGEILIGYPDANNVVSGSAPATPPPVPVSTDYNPTPTPPPATGFPAWMHNASFVVYRKLQQNVGGFRQSMSEAAASTGLAVENVGAKVVGRWPSGAPLERVPGMPRGLDPSTEDPFSKYPAVVGDKKINRFDYDHDPGGEHTPRAAHIRKVNPRSESLPDGDKTSLHRMLRRGITYGEEFVDSEPAYGATGPQTSAQDRGLLFISYQASIERSFEFVQRNWINRDSFQQAGDGVDPISSQTPEAGRTFSMPPNSASFSSWVSTRGGAYFVSMSLSQLAVLGKGA